MTIVTFERANKLVKDINSLKILTRQNADTLEITYGDATMAFQGDTKDDIIAYLCELRDIQKERFERL